MRRRTPYFRSNFSSVEKVSKVAKPSSKTNPEWKNCWSCGKGIDPSKCTHVKEITPTITAAICCMCSDILSMGSPEVW